MKMSEQKQKHRILVLNSPPHFQIFHDHLKNTLDTLECETVFTQEWNEALSLIDQNTSQFEMIIIDPMVPSFNEIAFQNAVIRSPRFQQTKILLIRYDITDSLYHLEDRLDVDGTISKTYGPHQIAFVINRLLFPGQQNRRLHGRALANLSVSYRLLEDHRTFDGDTVDVSVGGIFIRSFNPLGIGEQVKLTVHLPHEATPVRCNAKVVHNRTYISGPEAIMQPAGMGLNFMEIMSADRSRIFDFITSHLLRSERRATLRSIR